MKLSKIISLIGALLVIGTAGACDLNDISLKTAVFRAAIGILLVVFGALVNKAAAASAKKAVKQKKTVSMPELKKAV